MNKGIGHLICGATGTGKTTFIKSLFSKVNPDSIIVYDVNNEYSDFFPFPLQDFETFTDKLTRINNGIIALEESTIFLNNRGTNYNVTELLVRKRHSKNYIILVFHSLRSIPRYIYELSNYITVFKTNDSPQMTARELKDDRLEALMNEVKAAKSPFYFKTLKIY
jgi:ABC-type sugar transport system ATPase subunit